MTRRYGSASTNRQVQTEYAQSRLTGQPIYIGDAKSGLAGHAYVCPNPKCGWWMQAVKGSKRQPHFRHHPGGPLDADACNESRLHYDAKHILARTINGGGTVTVNYPCGCKRTRKEELAMLGTNVATANPFTAAKYHRKLFGPGLRAEVERRADWGDMERRPDVTVFDRGKVAAYFEVVVKHWPEYDIDDDRIEDPVIVVSVEGQEDLVELRQGNVRANEYRTGPCCTPPGPGIPCALIRQWERKRDEPYKQAAWRDLERMRNLQPPDAPLVQWRIDSFRRNGEPVERYLRWNTLADLHRRAQSLLERGFKQDRVRPALFTYDTPKVALYASLRSTDVLNIWDAPEPALWPKHKGHSPTPELSLYATALVQYAHHILNGTGSGARVFFIPSIY